VSRRRGINGKQHKTRKMVKTGAREGGKKKKMKDVMEDKDKDER
jgi:hypothetical protein